MPLSVSSRLLDAFLKRLVPKLSERIFDIVLLILVLIYQWHHGQLSMRALEDNWAEATYPWVWAVAVMAALILVKSACVLHVEMHEEADDRMQLFHPPSDLVHVPLYRTRIWTITLIGMFFLVLICYEAWRASTPVGPTVMQGGPPPDTGTAKKIGKPPAHLPPHPTPCTLRGGTYYPEPRLLPGGEHYTRPSFQLEMQDKVAWSWKDDNYLVLFQLTVTDRGEESITKNWELCLVDAGKPVRFHVGPIPDEGIVLQTGDKVTKVDSLPERTIRDPIPHGHVVTGWIGFAVPKTIALRLKDKVLPQGSITFEDYLAHKYSWDIVGTPDQPTKGYIPGNN